MALRASAIGKSLGESVVEVTPRMTMAYAAGLGEQDECYLDDLRPGGIVAPPPFCVVLEWPVVNGRGYRTVSGTSPEEAYGSIHVLQDSRFRRLVKPGDRLRTTGRVTQVRQTSAGALMVSKLETTDARTGDPVITSWFGAIFLRMAVEGAGAVLEEPPPLRAERGLTAGEAQQAVVAIGRTLPHIYTECADIWNPIHTERKIALATKLPDIILHGTATWALTAQALIRLRGGGDPARLARFAGRFHGMVIPGTAITIEYVSDRQHPGTVEFVVKNAAGEAALTHGLAEFTRGA
jgi:acyl dehydratase